ncbi:hypothetical protein AXG93_2817s1040 [Marchantia polymorpha subsp. ruderalis]|uniref:Uncharacterized protein n=1 Tax=Marchantia polymorpha subsp. ruderalis TaxID=1480154 RepID=A0A176W2P6_MARPO|nr:hypothetical protein AXG93_2817s1040 [Marchantia polymorpha subsp. ruderalis]
MQSTDVDIGFGQGLAKIEIGLARPAHAHAHAASSSPGAIILLQSSSKEFSIDTEHHPPQSQDKSALCQSARLLWMLRSDRSKNPSIRPDEPRTSSSSNVLPLRLEQQQQQQHWQAGDGNGANQRPETSSDSALWQLRPFRADGELQSGGRNGWTSPLVVLSQQRSTSSGARDGTGRGGEGREGRWVGGVENDKAHLPPPATDLESAKACMSNERESDEEEGGGDPSIGRSIDGDGAECCSRARS